MPSDKTVFMFSGQGSQYYQMGKQLLDSNAVFRDWMIYLNAVVQQQSGENVLDAIYARSKADVFDRTLLTHPAIFMVEYALAQCLIDEGILPDLTLGASLGSVAAAAIAGHLGVENAVTAVVAQAEAFESNCRPGGMIAILDKPSLYDETFLRGRSEMAGINFAGHFTVSALAGELDTIERELKARNITHQRLPVSFAFHSQWIDQAQPTFTAHMQTIPPHRGKLPLACCDRVESLTELPEGYFWDIVRHPIRFYDTLTSLEARGSYRYIDVGPSGTMATFARYGLPGHSRSSAHATLTPFGDDQKNLAALLQTFKRARAPAAAADHLQPGAWK